MRKIRVLVVDDSVVIRRMLTDILSQDPEIELAGTAPNGRIALAKLPQLNPDIVTLDIEMPELDGLATLPELRKTYPKLPVIMFSTLTERGALATLDALARGATDYVAKPANVGSVGAGIQSVKEQLLPKIKSLCPDFKPTAVAKLPPAPLKPLASRPTSAALQRCEVVAIGASTGGPQALTTVLKRIPGDFPLPIVVVQHMPPVFTYHLAQRLNQECQLTVCEAIAGEHLEPGTVYIAPGDFHLDLVRRGVDVYTVLQQGPPENSCRPAVDVLFRSTAATYGSGCLAVVLTGMGQDGKRGAEHVVSAGGRVLVQDAATSVVWGMPRAVAEAGLADSILPLGSISDAISRAAQVGRRVVINS